MTNINDLEVPATASNYTKLEEGTVKLRILSDFIDGYSDFDEANKVSLLYKKEDCPEVALSPRGFIYTWSCLVWNYDLKQLQIWQIKSKQLMAKLKTLAADADRGSDFGEYDLKISKAGKDKETKYDAVPANKKAPAPEIMEAMLTADIDLEKLYMGIDPFKK